MRQAIPLHAAQAPRGFEPRQAKELNLFAPVFNRCCESSGGVPSSAEAADLAELSLHVGDAHVAHAELCRRVGRGRCTNELR